LAASHAAAGESASAGSAAAPDPLLERDAEALHRALSDLVRMVQLRDRERICCHDISVTQCYALEALAASATEGITLNELAARMYLDKSTASRVVDSLVAKGYATRVPHPDDGRAVALRATAAGRRLYERIDADLLAEVRGAMAGFPAPVRAAMNELLQRFVVATARRVLGDGCCLPATASGALAATGALDCGPGCATGPAEAIEKA
jgi:DNA-binding MarR family transcriptional regulator